MAAPSYDELVEAMDRVIRAYYAEPPDGSGEPVARVLREVEDAMADVSILVGHAQHSLHQPAHARSANGDPTGRPAT